MLDAAGRDFPPCFALEELTLKTYALRKLQRHRKDLWHFRYPAFESGTENPINGTLAEALRVKGYEAIYAAMPEIGEREKK